jgi:ABC-type Fe3+-siderophore transport system permease subunit
MDIKQLRSHKIFGLAIFDIITSIIGMVIIFILFWKWHFSKLKVGNFILAGILLALPFGIIIHIIFGINTSLNYKLGLSNKPL